MLSTVRIAVLSAVLSGIVVSTLWTADAQAPLPASTKTFVDRLPETPMASVEMATTGAAFFAMKSAGHKGDRMAVGEDACRDAAWPYVPDACIAKARDESPRIIRTVTVEMRQGENTSVLVRMPQTVVAAR
jgi:hypothetical protein